MRLSFRGRPREFALVVLDCDGVVFDVNEAKTLAFFDALDGYPEAPRRALMDHHRRHGGVSRYEKFFYFFDTLHPPAGDVDAEVARAAARFAELVRAAYSAASLRLEALDFAARVGPASIAVVSGADEAELRAIFRDFALEARFPEVYGSPRGKVEHVERLLAERGLGAGDALFIGDGGGDYQAARATGVPFAFLAEMSEWRGAEAALAADPAVDIVPAWADLLARLDPT